MRRRSWFSSITCVILLRMLAMSALCPLRDTREAPSPLFILTLTVRTQFSTTDVAMHFAVSLRTENTSLSDHSVLLSLLPYTDGSGVSLPYESVRGYSTSC